MNKIIIEDQKEERVDKFLQRGFFLNKEITRGEIVKNIKNGNILVNGKIVKPSHTLKERDVISLNLKVKELKLTPVAEIEVPVIFEDKNVIVINKPAGLSVHPTTFEESDTLVNGLLYKFPEIEKINDGTLGAELRPGIVHRLDKDTSGTMVIARNQKSFDELKELFRERKVIKKYWAIVYGKINAKRGIIDLPIARASNYKKQSIASRKTKTKIREAVTEYEVLSEYKKYSLVELTPRTGRMHQIRIHLFSLGHPVVGDDLYKLRKFNNVIEVNRQLLHAKSIKFNLGGRGYEFSSELPGDMKKFTRGIDERLI